MSRRFRRPRFLTWQRAILWSIALLLAAAWTVQRLSAERYRAPIQNALETALARKVKLGALRFSLLPLPGFTIKDVIIGEDPAIGPEAVAYVTTLHARPNFLALLGGPLTLASVDLEETSVNLTRTDQPTAEVRWNFSELMNPKLLATFPDIHMRGGRVNFKFGETKSVFYFSNTDVDLWPPDRSDGPWTIRIRAEPARTDRPSRSFAAFTARGQWDPRGATMTLDARLEKSELGDIVTLFQGSESNLHGHISGDAHFAGPLNRMGLAGKLAIDEIHGWNQTPPSGGAWPFDISGAVDIPGQSMQLRALISGTQPSPLDLRYRVEGYLGRPRWGVNAIFHGLALAPLASMARNLGVPVPADYQIEGTADGAVGYSFAAGQPRVDGDLHVVNASFGFSGSKPVKMLGSTLLFDGTRITMPSALAMQETESESAAVQGQWDMSTRLLTVSLSSAGMSLEPLRRQAAAMDIPVLSEATSGTWSGSLRYSSGGGWTGDVHLKDTTVPFEAFSEPLKLITADAVLEGADVSMRRLAFSLGPLEGQGEYRYQSGSPRPHRFRFVLQNADAATIERLAMPALHRGSFLNYAFNFGRVPEPGWMQAMHADGSLQIGTLTLAGQTFSRVRTQVVWDGSDVRLRSLEAQVAGAAFSGVADASLAQRQPAYAISGHLAGFVWRSGVLAGEGTIDTSGTGGDLLANMSAKGAVRGARIELGPESVYDTVEGCFDWGWDSKNPRLNVNQLILTAGGETYIGSAEMRNGGQLTLHASSGSRQIQVSGALLRGDPLKPAAP